MPTTTTTTTRVTTSSTTVTIDGGYLLPHGILKILEIILSIVVFSMVVADNFHKYKDILNVPVFVGVVFFLTTLVLFLCFLCAVYNRCCGRSVCFIIDTIHNVVAAALFFAAFIILCINCTVKYRNYTYVYDKLVVAAVCSIVNVILYILSIVFARRAGWTSVTVTA